jgi:hypothetical protein
MDFSGHALASRFASQHYLKKMANRILLRVDNALPRELDHSRARKPHPPTPQGHGRLPGGSLLRATGPLLAIG